MRILLSAVLALIATVVAHAGVKVTQLDWKPQGKQGRFIVSLSTPVTTTPEWDVKGGRFAMTLPGAEIEQNTVKKIEGVRVAAANTTRGVLATLTFPTGVISADSIALTLQDGKIEITTSIPKTVEPKKTDSAFKVTSPIDLSKKTTISKQELGEDYLKKIEAEMNTEPAVPVVAEAQPVVVESVKEEIKTTQAAPARENGFSFAGYAGKFLAFLGLVLLFFYGVIQLMKKGVLSKGKLGFLNNAQLVSVLSTTYVAPKRSILLIKAHNQAFLVSSSESGMQFIAEVKDVPGLVKEGERTLAGSNFDDSVNVANETAPREEIKIKEDIYQSTAIEARAGIQKDIVRFSDELKKKVKNLKSLQ